MQAVELERHRPALVGHCYRMLGSATDADDAVQETLLRAWRHADGFDGRASLRTWLYRIATNVCLDQLARAKRRERPVEGPRGTIDDELIERPRSHWLEPIPDARALPDDPDPGQLAVLRQSIRLAFVAALQHLPPRQRAALLLKDVLGFSAQEIAEALETSVPAINSTLQRARATLKQGELEGAEAALSEADQALLERYVDAFHRYDVEALTGLLRDDAVLSMPPYTLWLEGPRAIGDWFLGRGIGCKGSTLIPTRACGSPAFGQYRPGGVPWSLIVLELKGGRVASMTHFLDTERLFPRFGLPLELLSSAG
ncbi:MAG: sigma-70 family RNA polymerase sigma factor [Myxococcota bacterium]|nr:sigma-70 family RNA polymerase sigma factor [Myxococcota bacterium]